MIDAGADVNVRNADGDTPLHEAVFGDWDSPTSTQVLLENGANVDAVGQFGKTPLMHATMAGSVACVQLLLAAGANSDCQDDSAESAKSYALEYLEIRRSLNDDSPDEASTWSSPSIADRKQRNRELLAEAEEIVGLLIDE